MQLFESTHQERPTLGDDRVQIVPGYVYGLAQPCVRLEVRVPVGGDLFEPVCLADSRLQVMPEGLESVKAPALERDGMASRREQAALAWLSCFNQWLVRLQLSAGWPVCAGIVVEALECGAGNARAEPEAHETARLVVPTFLPGIFGRLIPSMVSVLSEKRSPARKHTGELLAALGRHAVPDTNTRHLVAGAYRLGVPVNVLAGKTMQYGWGSRARWMDSTFTDSDSVIAAQLARNKVGTNTLLRRGGFPVPAQASVATADAAVTQAEKLGYPVVIKPSDLDGGRGVEAGIPDEPTLRAAFARARTHSQRLVLEQHIPGRDYRLTVFYGELAWATYREPAGVWGDGEASVAELIEHANRDPRRGTHKWSQMVPLTMNDEAHELLAEQGLSLASTPGEGVFVRLRRAANTSSGGRPMDVSAMVHPDNAALAVRVARLFRLQLVGIDFICPDISRSWHEVGGAICEVNGQPQFTLTRPDTPEKVVAGLVRGDGRIPVVVILADLPFGQWAEVLSDDCQAKGVRLAVVTKEGGFVARELWIEGGRSPFQTVRSLLIDSSVDAIVVATNALQWLETGLPVDRLSCVVAEHDADPEILSVLGGHEGANGQTRLMQVPQMPDSADPAPGWLATLANQHILNASKVKP